MSDSEEFDSKSESDECTYKLDGLLNPTRTVSYSVGALHDQIVQCTIDLNPEYQRGEVWNQEKQTMLIDSFFRNYYIPPIIFHCQYEEDGDERRTCIDGKQRLSSICRFLEGEIPFKDRVKKKTFWFKINPAIHQGKRRQPDLLPGKYRMSFINKQVNCVEYEGLTQVAERDVFARVQLGMPLTPAEKMAVISSPRTEFVQEIIKVFVNEDTLLSPNIVWDHRRANDFKAVSTVVFLLSKPLAEISTSWPNVGQVSKWLAGRQEISKTLRAKVVSTFELFVKLVTQPAQERELITGKWKVAPVEIVGISLLISEHGETTPTENLCVMIGKMRRALHTKHEKRVLMNSVVFGTILEYVKDPDARNLVVSPAAKRKRDGNSDVKDEEYSRRPEKMLGPAKKKERFLSHD